MWLLLRSGPERAEAANLTGLHARPWAVLELLLLRPNRTVTTDEIIDQLWPEGAAENARNSVQRFVADIRGALGEHRSILRTVGAGYQLTVEPDQIDVEQVRALQHQAVDQLVDHPALAVNLLETAIGHFGDLEATAAATPAADAARRTHHELRLELIDQHVEARLATGAGAELVSELRTLTEEHPYRERFWGQLMRALRADGQRVEALRVFEQLRRRLAEDIGIGPSDELCQLELQILTESEDQPDDGPATGADGGDRVDADDLTPADLIGRDVEIAKVLDLLATNRVVTVTGPGGVGKTRLVTEVARRTNDPEDPAIIRLAEAGRDDQVPTVVATGLGLQSEALDSDGVLEDVLVDIGRSARLIVLDNAEHVTDSVRHLLERVGDSGGCRFLISSRQRIGLSGERVTGLGPLSLPAIRDHDRGDDRDGRAEGQSDAEQLFHLRASAVDASLEGQEETVAAICRALDGLPLAIELAASQLAQVGLQDLLDRLDARRLELSSSPGQRTRHSSLASMMEWSWGLLSADEIALLEQLSVFNSPIDVGAVEDIADAEGIADGGAFAVLTSLVARSLVTSTVVDGRARFTLLETVRLYALTRAEQDGRLAACRDAHAAYLLRFLRQWSLPELNAWLDTIDEIEVHQLEYDPAIEHLDRRGREAEVIEFVVRVSGLWARRGPGELLSRWADRLIELDKTNDLDHETRAAIAVVASEERFRFSDYEGMGRHGERLVALEDQQATDLGTPFVAFYATALYSFTMDDESRRRIELANQRAATTPSKHLNVAQTEMWLGCCQLVSRQYEDALASFDAVLSRTRRPGGVVLWSELGRVAALHLLDRPAEAAAAMAEVSTDDDSIWTYAIDIVRAVVTATAGDPERARSDLVASAHHRIRERRAASRDDFQIGFGLVAAAAGETALADTLLSDPMPQSPVTCALLVNHLHPDVSPDAWRATWSSELITRLLSSTERLGHELAPVKAELARWAPATADR